jgi:DNA-binding LacI/PurR family transcriptional regulator
MALESKTVTINHIAERLKVSPGTVSSVLNGHSKQRRISKQTAEKIMQLAGELNYIPNELARSLRRKRTGVIGIVFGTLMNNWAHLALQGIHSVLNPRQYFPFIAVSYWDTEVEANEFALLMQRRVEGIICVPTPGGHNTYQQAINQKIPFVFLNDVPLDMTYASYIAWDAEQATRVAVRHLIDCGYKRIALIGSDHQTLMTQARFKAYIETLLEAGLEINQQWIGWYPVTNQFEPLFEQVLNRIYFESSYPPDAFFFTFDPLAMLAMRIFKKRGVQVPEDIGLIGMGDLEGIDEMDLGLTTVHEPLEEMAHMAANVILALIDNPDCGPLQHVVQGNALKIRRTTRSIK